MVTLKIFRERLKELRVKNAIGRNTLAKAIDVSARTVFSWENGISTPAARYIMKLAEFFNISSDYLLGLEIKNSI